MWKYDYNEFQFIMAGSDAKYVERGEILSQASISIFPFFVVF